MNQEQNNVSEGTINSFADFPDIEDTASKYICDDCQ